MAIMVQAYDEQAIQDFFPIDAQFQFTGGSPGIAQKVFVVKRNGPEAVVFIEKGDTENRWAAPVSCFDYVSLPFYMIRGQFIRLDN